MAENETPAEDPQTEASAGQENDGDAVTVSPVDLPQVDEVAHDGNAKVDPELNLNMILDIPVEIRVELGNTRLSIREVLNLGKGSIVELDRAAGSPADIIVNGKLIGQGDVVVVNENFGIRITKLVDPQERIDSL